jgi:ankyrin repeat protein
LLDRGARVARTWAIGAAVFNDQPDAVTLLLDALAAGGGRGAADAATEALPEAAATASFPVVAALLDAGADPRAVDDDGVSALRLAVRAGKAETAARLRALGAAEDDTDVDRFLGACRSGDRPAAERLLAGHPDLPSRLTDEDRAVIWDAAASGPAETLALLLDLGFPPHAARFGEQPLHNAAYHGNAAAVRLLLAAGAEVDARDARFDATPLAFATVGSGEQAGQPGDWIETVRLLIDSGASRDGVWISDKPPSEEVTEVLRRSGIAPDEPARGQHRDDQAAMPGSIGTGPLAEVARHLEAAYRDSDIELLGSLLHPDVHWSGCSNKAQVLDWYRGFQADGTIAAVTSVEADHDAVVLGLSVSRRADGARPAPAQQLYQVFTIAGAEIVDIRFYPDRASALARGAHA